MSMKVYKPTRLRRYQILAMVLRGFVKLIALWPWLLVAVMFISPVSPHLLIRYSYEQHGNYRYMFHCEYLGARGLVNYMPNHGKCPLITIIDRREK